MGTEYEPSIFKVNPEYRNWKNESAGISSDYSPLPTTQQDILALPSVLERRLEKYEEKAVGPWKRAVKNWVTEKARVTEIVNLFPNDMVIPQVAVKADDKKSIRDAMFSLLKEGENCLGVRTCYFPDLMGKAPYSMGKIRDKKGITHFLREEYPAWLKTEARGPEDEHLELEEIIVQANPPLLGKAGEENKHFVFITIEEPDRLLTEVCLNTFHLRSIETGGIDDFVEITQPVVPGQIFRAHLLQTSIGRKHWNEELTKEISSLVQKTIEPMRRRFNPIDRLKGFHDKELTIANFEYLLPKENPFISEWPDDEQERLGSDTEELHDKYVEKVVKHGEFRETARKIASLIFDPMYILGATTPTELSIQGNIDKIITDGTLPTNLYEELINPRTWEATNNLKRIVHQEWLSPPMDIYLRLMALNNVCVLPGQEAGSGHCAVEVQGAYDSKGKIEYTKIYAIRGREEKEFADRAKRRLTTRAV